MTDRIIVATVFVSLMAILLVIARLESDSH